MVAGTGAGGAEVGAGAAAGNTATPREIVDFLREVKDPEVPVLDIVEMGIVRRAVVEEGHVIVDVTPTYSGCPAMQVIEEGITTTLREQGFASIEVRTVLHPAWTTDWMTDDAREKLRAYGIAPPDPVERFTPIQFSRTVRVVLCPFCRSGDTEIRSVFGSTACKSMHYCKACHQPFEHFKPH